jgi:hypothetical protein
MPVVGRDVGPDWRRGGNDTKIAWRGGSKMRTREAQVGMGRMMIVFWEGGFIDP